MTVSLNLEAHASNANSSDEEYTPTSSGLSNTTFGIPLANDRNLGTNHYYAPSYLDRQPTGSHFNNRIARDPNPLHVYGPYRNLFPLPFPVATHLSQTPAIPPISRPNLAQGHQHMPAIGPIVNPAQQVSKNYQGNRYAQRNQSANIDPEQSTSVWITNLPPDCNYAELLGMIRGTGKVYATVINPPQGTFMTSAAKIVFFTVAGRQRLEARAREGDFTVKNYIPHVRPNRILTAAQPPGLGSRVLHITGPAAVVNRETLCEFFRRWCAFDLEYVTHSQLPGGRATMEWAFGSYRCQAERVFAAIRGTRAFGVDPPRGDIWGLVVVRYGWDPCDQ